MTDGCSRHTSKSFSLASVEMDSRNRAPADEIRHFTHEDIEGPEGHGEDDLENCDMLSEGSDTADPREHTLPPYPGHTSIAGKFSGGAAFEMIILSWQTGVY